MCACTGRVACLHSDNLPDSPTLCPYLCALRCPRYPRVASPLCAALALVVLVTRVLTQGGTWDGVELAFPYSQEAIACHESCFYAWGGWLSEIELVARESPCRRWLSPQLFCGTRELHWETQCTHPTDDPDRRRYDQRVGSRTRYRIWSWSHAPQRAIGHVLRVCGPATQRIRRATCHKNLVRSKRSEPQMS